MTLQEKFTHARIEMQKFVYEKVANSTLSFVTLELDDFTVKTEIYAGDTILSVGASRDTGKISNQTYLYSMLNAIANYNPNLIPKE